MRRILCLRLPNWPITRHRAENLAGVRAAPPGNDPPLVLYETARGARRVTARSRRAAALGVEVGMPLTEAQSLLGSRDPANRLTVEEEDPQGDREALVQWAQWCRRHSPTVGVETGPRPDSIFLDLTGLAHLIGDEASLARILQKQFAQEALPTRVAVTETLGAAWALAHGVPEPCVIVPPGEVETAIFPLRIETLRLPEKAIDLLHQLGFHEIGPLATLPREDLTVRFGPELLDRLDQATGRRSEPFPALALPTTFRASLTLEHPTRRRDTLECVLERLCQEVAQRLQTEGRQAVRVECLLREPSGTYHDLTVGLYQPTASASHLADLLKMRLERTALPVRVETVSVEATITIRRQCRQTQLFADEASLQQARETAALVDRLSGRLGAKAVSRVGLRREALPEFAYAYRAATGPRNGRTRTRTQTAEEIPLRPIHLLSQPVPLGSTDNGHPPRCWTHNGRTYHVFRCWGPERIETGWWRGPMAARDYYRIETTCGARCWCFRNLRSGGWFLHGWF